MEVVEESSESYGQVPVTEDNSLGGALGERCCEESWEQWRCLTVLPLVYMMMAVVDRLGGSGLSASSSGDAFPLWKLLV